MNARARPANASKHAFDEISHENRETSNCVFLVTHQETTVELLWGDFFTISNAINTD